jgi:hypothetical protein
MAGRGACTLSSVMLLGREISVAELSVALLAAKLRQSLSFCTYGKMQQSDQTLASRHKRIRSHLSRVSRAIDTVEQATHPLR